VNILKVRLLCVLQDISTAFLLHFMDFYDKTWFAFFSMFSLNASNNHDKN